MAQPRSCRAHRPCCRPCHLARRPLTRASAPWPDCTVRATAVIGPGILNVDTSIIRNFRVWSKSLQFRLEAFNALNIPNWDDPNTTLTNPLYGTINRTRKPMRELQLGVKFVF